MLHGLGSNVAWLGIERMESDHDDTTLSTMAYAHIQCLMHRISGARVGSGKDAVAVHTMLSPAASMHTDAKAVKYMATCPYLASC